MTRRKSLATIHEPFGDAFYYGPERMGARFEDDEQEREKSGFADSTFKSILDRIEKEGAEVCHLLHLYTHHFRSFHLLKTSARNHKILYCVTMC